MNKVRVYQMIGDLANEGAEGKIEVQFGHLAGGLRDGLRSVTEYKRVVRFIRTLDTTTKASFQIRFWDREGVRNYGDVWEQKTETYRRDYTSYGFRLVIANTVIVDPYDGDVSFTRFIRRETGKKIYNGTEVSFIVSKVENIRPDGGKEYSYEFEVKLEDGYNQSRWANFDKAVDEAFRVVNDTVVSYTHEEMNDFKRSVSAKLDVAGDVSLSYFPIHRPLMYDDFPCGLVDGDFEYFVSERPKGSRKIIAFNDIGMWAWYPPNEFSLLARRDDLGVFSDSIFEAVLVDIEDRKVTETNEYINSKFSRPSVVYLTDCLSNNYQKRGVQTFGYRTRLGECREFAEGFEEIPAVYISNVTYHRVDRANFFSVIGLVLDQIKDLPYNAKGLTFTPETSYNSAKNYFGTDRTLSNVPDVCIWEPKYTLDAYVRVDAGGTFSLWSSDYIRLNGLLNPNDPILLDENRNVIDNDTIVEFEYNDSIKEEYLPLKGLRIRSDKISPNSIQRIEDLIKLMQDPITPKVMYGVSNFLLMAHYHERLIKLLGGVPLKEAEKLPDHTVETIFADVTTRSDHLLRVARSKLVPVGGRITFLTFDKDAIEELLAPRLGGIVHYQFEGDGFYLDLEPSGMVIVGVDNASGESEEVVYSALDFERFAKFGTIEKYRADTEIGKNIPPLLNNREYLLSRIHAYGEITIPTLNEMSAESPKTFCSLPADPSKGDFGGNLSMLSTKAAVGVRKIVNHWDPDNDYVRIRTIGDGNCFFHAVLQAVYPPYNSLTRADKVKLVAEIRFDVSQFIDIEDPDDAPFKLTKWARYKGGQWAISFLNQLVSLQTSCYNRINAREIPFDKKDDLDTRVPFKDDYDAEDQSQVGHMLRLATVGEFTGDVAYILLSELLQIDILVYEIRERGLPIVMTTQKEGSVNPCVMIGHVGGNHYETIGMVEKNEEGEDYLKLVWEADSLPANIFPQKQPDIPEDYDSVMNNFTEAGNPILNRMFSNAYNMEYERLGVFLYLRPHFGDSFEHMVTKLFREYSPDESYEPLGPSEINEDEWPDEPDEDPDIPLCTKDQITILESLEPESEFLKRIREQKARAPRRRPTKTPIKPKSPPPKEKSSSPKAKSRSPSPVPKEKSKSPSPKPPSKEKSRSPSPKPPPKEKSRSPKGKEPEEVPLITPTRRKPPPKRGGRTLIVPPKTPSPPPPRAKSPSPRPKTPTPKIKTPSPPPRAKSPSPKIKTPSPPPPRAKSPSPKAAPPPKAKAAPRKRRAHVLIV